MFSDSDADIWCNRARTPEPPCNGPRLAVELQILATVQQMALQQQLMAAHISELHHMFQAVPKTDTAAAAEAAAIAAAAELEEQRARAEDLQQQLKKRQRPGARMRRRLRGEKDTASKEEPEKADEDAVAMVDCGEKIKKRVAAEDAQVVAEKEDYVSDAESDFLGLFRDDMQADQQYISGDTLLEASMREAILGSANCKEVNAKDKDDWTALHFAAANGDAKACSAILNRADFSEADAKDTDGRTVLHWAAASNNADACQVILAHEGFTEVDAKDTMRGWTALHWAAAEGHLEACQAILDCVDFTEINAQEKLGGWTALHLAAWAGHAEVCGAILSHCDFIDADKPNNNGDTAMTLAVRNGHSEIVELIKGYEHWLFYRER